MKQTKLSILLLGAATASALPGSNPPPYGNPPPYSPPPYTSNTCPAVTTTSTTTITQTSTETCTVTSTSTTSVISTSTVSNCPTPSLPSLPVPTGACALINPLCNAKPGWSVAYYANPFAGYGYPPSGLGPGYYISENLQPLGVGSTTSAYFPNASPAADDPLVYPGTSYDDGNAPYYVGFTIDVAGITVDANNFTLVYSGLYRAPATGNHSLCAGADNIVNLFVGADQAFGCAGDHAASATASPALDVGFVRGDDPAAPSTCFQMDFVKGFEYPIRLVMANFQGPTFFGFSIAPPGGEATVDFTGLVTSPSCALA